jgi:hypothetical protein
MEKTLQNKYPHIYNKLILLWSTEECRTYICDILKDTRGDTRVGFPFDVAEELIAILSEHDRLYPYYNKPSHISFKSYRRPTMITNSVSNPRKYIPWILTLLGIAYIIKNYIMPV